MQTYLQQQICFFIQVAGHDCNSVWVLQLGFLYLRYVLNPRQVWEWLQYYINDQEVGICIKCKLFAML